MRLNHLPLTSSTVRALSDGAYFLAHGRELLAAVALEPYCLQCGRLGFDAKVNLLPDSIIANWTCGHTAGWASRKKRIDTAELLYALGWDIRCSACKEKASGDNSASDPTFKVLCPCTVRLLANPLVKAGGLSALDDLGRTKRI
jgi:hypothetical protein